MAKPKEEFTIEEARAVASKLGIDWATVDFKLEDFTDGINVELEHGLKYPETNVTNDDPVMTGKIALAHLNESGKYYEGLEKMEEELEENEENDDLCDEAKEIGMKVKAANMLRAKASGQPIDIY